MGLALNASTRSAARTALVLALLLLALSACSLINRNADGSQLGHETVLAEQGVLTCSSQCRERGQCGTAGDQTVVLGGLVQPRTSEHDLLLPANSPVTILSSQAYTVRQRLDQTEFPINFYVVSTQDNTKAGWVAGWCLAAP
ncbi:MAG: hypothetical protein KC425_22960 [Anaerolineales bacterium]|nr:hypothetical protein [Anaerolineales bacterium]